MSLILFSKVEKQDAFFLNLKSYIDFKFSKFNISCVEDHARKHDLEILESHLLGMLNKQILRVCFEYPQLTIIAEGLHLFISF